MSKLLIIFISAFLFISCQENKTENNLNVEPLEISQAWMRPGVENRNTAAFMTIKNNTGYDDTLFSVSSEAAKVVELHETFTRENDLKGMRHVELIVIPSNSSVELKPGSFHVMLIGLNKNFRKGEKGEIKLAFKNNDTVSLTTEVK